MDEEEQVIVLSLTLQMEGLKCMCNPSRNLDASCRSPETEVLSHVGGEMEKRFSLSRRPRSITALAKRTVKGSEAAAEERARGFEAVTNGTFATPRLNLQEK